MRALPGGPTLTVALETTSHRSHAWQADLFESKLEPAWTRRGAVVKAALVERLCACRTASLVDVVAPAGYGKTTLLAHWAASDPRPFAWLAADAEDNDPRVLVEYLSTALARGCQVVSGVQAAGSRRSRPGWRAALRRLGAALADAPPLVLVVDDAHLIREPES